MENLPTYRLTQSGPEAQEILDQVNLNTVDIEQLKRLYQALTQSEPEIIEPTDTWPVANPEENVIYRVIDRVNTPPQYYTDYMWNGTSMVPMAKYDNAIDNEPTANSNNLVKSGGVYSFVHANGGAYDISAAHAVGGVLATYDDLADALGTNGANVPAAVRKGGMSIKYVNSSDNKYVQYRLMVTDVSDFTNTDNWSFCGDDVFVENPEFIRVYTDKDNRILWAIKTDGTIYFGAGVPPQVIDYIQAQISALSLDEYEDIVTFLGSLINGDTLSTLLANKVDKVEGKSLINAGYAGTKNAIENPEYLEVTTDSEDRIVEGIRTDGTKEINTPINANAGEVNLDGMEIKVIDNPEFLRVELDNEGRILSATRKDGSHYIHNIESETLDAINTNIKAKVDKEEGKSLIDSEVADGIGYVENPEYIQVDIDTDSRILGGRKIDGKKFENVGFETPNISVDGNSVETMEDIENRIEMKLDADEKIISYRDSKGILHEEAGIALSPNAMSDFQKALKSAGFQGGGMDFSNTMTIELPEPKHYGLLNIVGDFLPKYSAETIDGYAEYYDFAGNYFKKKCQISIQGQSSRLYASSGGKGNYTLDIADGSEIKFGSWVPQDSFHLKGCAKDVTRGILATSYKFAYKFMEYLDAKPNRVLKKSNTQTTLTHASGDRFTDWPSDARCLPDGFPIELYINGEYWGLYSLQLKKHRKNYSMKKSDYTSFILDADNFGSFWLGTIPWTQFEIRNPKDLICMDGSKYDGDNPKELIDSTSQYYNAGNAKHVGSATTKSIIESFSTKYLAVKTLIDNNDLVAAKALFADYFDVNACMLVYIFNCTTKNKDSISKNTLWGTYKNGKIAPMLYDLDDMYGQGFVGTSAVAPSSDLWNHDYANAKWPLALLWVLYNDEIKATYANLRRDGVISIDTWHHIMFDEWVERIGTEAYERDIEKWPDTASYRENYTNTDFWEEKSLIGSLDNVSLWDENSSYQQGDIVALSLYPGQSLYLTYEAIQPSTDVCPVTQFYSSYPVVGGYYDSPKRKEKWLTEQIKLCDIQNDYFDELVADFTAYRTTDEGYEIECTNMTVDTKLSKEYNYIQGHITRHETVIEGQTVSIYTIDGGAETPEDMSKTYTTVRAAIETAASQPVDIPSENVYYIKARAKNINYHKR